MIYCVNSGESNLLEFLDPNFFVFLIYVCTFANLCVLVLYCAFIQLYIFQKKFFKMAGG